MKRRSIIAATAVGAMSALLISACSSSSSSSGSSSTTPTTGAVAFNAGISSVVNPSSTKGGTLTFDVRGTPDSFDPGNTYYAWVLDFDHLFTMPLFGYKSCPGSCGLQLVPDLATDMGTTSDNGLTWTFHIQPDVKFENGTVVNSQDVKYAIERTYDRSVMANGPTYYQALLTDPTYPGPYKDRSKNLMGLTAVDTPNATTLVFHLQAPFPDLPYVLAFPNTAPVLPSADTGSNYQLHPLSTGPYMFKSYTLNKQLVMVDNPNWNPATDPNAKQLATQIIVNMNVNQADIDNNLIAGNADIDAYGAGVGPAAQARILGSSSLKANADNPINGFARFVYINTKVAPLTNAALPRGGGVRGEQDDDADLVGRPGRGRSDREHDHAARHRGLQVVRLLQRADPAGRRHHRGQAAARDVRPAERLHHEHGLPLGQPAGDRGGRPHCRPRWPQVGIKLTLKGFPSGPYYTNFAGDPAYVHAHDIGLAGGGWGADWPDGYGFLDELLNGNAIAATGNTNISEINDPVINNLFTESSKLTGDARTAIWSQIDEQAMKDAVILPAVYQKTLLYRNPATTNVYVQAYYGMYNYAVMGVSS